jgi:hypothetical protein
MKTKITATHTPIHPAGTIDVISLDGQHAWRIRGLAFN